MRKFLISIIIVLCVIGVGGYLLYHIEIYSGTLISPCEQYRIDYYYYLGEGFLPMMPGSGSDKAGCLYIYRQADNKRLHREELPMLSMVGNITFWRTKDGRYIVSAPCWLDFELEEGKQEPELLTDGNH